MNQEKDLGRSQDLLICFELSVESGKFAHFAQGRRGTCTTTNNRDGVDVAKGNQTSSSTASTVISNTVRGRGQFCGACIHD